MLSLEEFLKGLIVSFVSVICFIAESIAVRREVFFQLLRLQEGLRLLSGLRKAFELSDRRPESSKDEFSLLPLRGFSSGQGYQRPSD